MASINPYSNNLDQRQASHLLRRASFHFTIQRVNELTGLTPQAAISNLMQDYTLSITEPLNLDTGQLWINSGPEPITNNQKRYKNYIISWWINEARQNTGIKHKLEFFLHTVFTLDKDLTKKAPNFFDYIELIRNYAFGDFKEFAFKMSKSNSMLMFLNNDENDANNPNENYAREFLELFTIGKGEQAGVGDYTTYTELDVQQAARVLTGFKKDLTRLTIDPDTSLPMGKNQFNKHDQQNKIFSNRFQNTTIIAATSQEDMDRELRDMIDMIFNQEATARYFCRKLYRYFVKSTITEEIETDIITPLAQEFISQNFTIQPVVEMLLKSEHFYDLDDSDSTDNTIGALIASPLDNILKTITFFNIESPDHFNDTTRFYRYYKNYIVDVFCSLSGMELYTPPTVAGYEAYHQAPSYSEMWFNSSNIIARYKMGETFTTGLRLIAGGNNGPVYVDMVNFVENNITNASDAVVLVNELVTFLFPENIDNDRMNYFLNDVFLDGLSTINWQIEWNNYLNNGNSSDVEIPLNRLFKTLMYSQEYQCI